MPDDLEQLARDNDFQDRWRIPPRDSSLQNLAGQQQMTHRSEQPNPAQPYLDAASHFAAPLFDPARHGGIVGVLQGLGFSLPDWITAPQAVLNNPQANQAFALEAGIPWKPAELATLKAMVNSGILDFSRLPGRTPTAIYSMIDRQGLTGQARQETVPYVRKAGSPTVAGNPKMVETINRLMKLDPNMTHAQLASRIGMSERSVRRYVRENLGQARRDVTWIDPERQQLYMDMIAHGFNLSQMAKKLGIAESTVRDQVWRLVQEGHFDYTPQGGIRTPSMPSFSFKGQVAAGDPEYERALQTYLGSVRPK